MSLNAVSTTGKVFGQKKRDISLSRLQRQSNSCGKMVKVGRFLGFGGILVIFWVLGGILVILRFRRYFGYFLGLGGILVIFKF